MNKTVRRALVAACLAVVTCAGTTSASSAMAAAPPRPVQIPHDEAAHRAPTEWWYFNGHLSGVDAQGRQHRYGFEYVTFKFEDTTSPPVYVANFAVTDLTRQTFSYAARADSYPRPADRNSFDLHTAGWTMSGSGGSDALHATQAGYGLALRTVAAAPVTLHGGNGQIPFAPFGRSAYYSWTSLAVRGTIIDHGVPVKVSGTSWMDHQWGPFDFSGGGGWDWFGLRLDDGRRYMLYFLRDASGRIVETVGTLITRSGHAVQIPSRCFAERATGSWTSPATGITYSSGWDVRVPGGELHVRPRLLDQELDVRAIQGVAYWEGDVGVRGVIDHRPVSGVGYTEINPANQP